jgi:hypothetical protein
MKKKISPSIRKVVSTTSKYSNAVLQTIIIYENDMSDLVSVLRHFYYQVLIIADPRLEVAWK